MQILLSTAHLNSDFHTVTREHLTTSDVQSFGRFTKVIDASFRRAWLLFFGVILSFPERIASGVAASHQLILIDLT
jgi:hypothetical protein